MSVVSLMLSTLLSAQSLATSRQSVELFRQSNDIMLGQVRALPQVEVSPDVLAIGIDSLDQLTGDSAQQSLTVWNSGRVAISELTIDLIAIDGLVHRVDDLTESYRAIAPTRERLVLTEQLIPDGRARLRVKPCMLAYIDQAKISYRNPDAKYRFVANAVVLATRFGDPAPLPRSGNDSTLITVDYVPRLLGDQAVQAYLRTERCATQVFR